MPKKIKITTEQENKLFEHFINEVSVMDGLKHALSLFGRYKVNGKIFGKGKATRDAEARIKAIINKEGNEIIRRLSNNLGSQFPNNVTGKSFLMGVLLIAGVYDTIVNATEKDEQDPEYLPVDVANGIIDDLREYVKKFLDVDLKSIYSVANEIQGKGLGLTESEINEFDADEWDVRDDLRRKRNGGQDFPSTRMNTLGSNKATIGSTILGGAGVGAALTKMGATVLGPIGVQLLLTGALVKAFRMKGAKSSRAKTLYDLYQSIRNLDGGVLPDDENDSEQNLQEPEQPTQQTHVLPGANDVPRATSPSKETDELYNSLRNLFQFIVNNRKNLGVRAADNVGTGAASNMLKAGDKRKYNNMNVVILKPQLDGQPNRAQVKDVNKGTIFTVDVRKLGFPSTNQPHPLSNRQRFEEGYITNKRVIQFLNKNLSLDKLKSFEKLIGSIDTLRNRISKINVSQDKVLAGYINALKSNPIMSTDFRQIFNVADTNPQAVNSLKAFIDDLFITLYSGKYKFDSIVGKMGTAGGGNINKLEEDNRDPQNMRGFKNNLLKFLQDAINLFQYLSKIKQQGGQQQPQDTAQPQAATQPEPDNDGEGDNEDDGSNQPFMPVRYESVEKISEEINKIKKIMLG